MGKHLHLKHKLMKLGFNPPEPGAKHFFLYAMENHKNQIIAILKQRDSVIFAYLFGSSATKTLTPMSDIDIAVYLNENVTPLEERLDLIGELMMTLKMDDIDLVILNSVPLTLKARIIQNKEMLTDNKPLEKIATTFLREKTKLI